MKLDNIVKESEPICREDKVLNYIQQHQDEAYPYYDPDLEKAFPDINKETLSFYLYNLAKNKKIEKTKIGRYVYFGSKVAIEELIKKLPKDKKPNE